MHKLQTLQILIILTRPDYENNPELQPHLHRSCSGYWILGDPRVYFIISLLMLERLYFLRLILRSAPPHPHPPHPPWFSLSLSVLILKRDPLNNQ